MSSHRKTSQTCLSVTCCRYSFPIKCGKPCYCNSDHRYRIHVIFEPIVLGFKISPLICIEISQVLLYVVVRELYFILTVLSSVAACKFGTVIRFKKNLISRKFDVLLLANSTSSGTNDLHSQFHTKILKRPPLQQSK